MTGLKGSHFSGKPGKSGNVMEFWIAWNRSGIFLAKLKTLHIMQLCLLVFRWLPGEAPVYLTEMHWGLIARRFVAFSLFHGHSPWPLALVGLRSLDRLHGTHSQHTWKIKICLLFSDLNSKLTFLAPKSLNMFFSCVWPICFGRVHFCPQAAQHSPNGYWFVRERLQMIFRVVSSALLKKHNRLINWSSSQ